LVNHPETRLETSGSAHGANEPDSVGLVQRPNSSAIQEASKLVSVRIPSLVQPARHETTERADRFLLILAFAAENVDEGLVAV
jgi:hypothetical protein